MSSFNRPAKAKAQALRRSDATRRSPPLPSKSLEFVFDPQSGLSVVGMLPASPGTYVQRLERDGQVIDEQPISVVGFAVFKSFHHPEKAELWVKPITGIGIVRGRYVLIEEAK